MKHSILKSRGRRRHRRKALFLNVNINDTIVRLLFKLISSLNPQNAHQSLARIQNGESEIFSKKHRDHEEGIANGSTTSKSIQEDCVRFVFRPTEESNYEINIPELIHYYISTKLFYQNIEKCTNKDLPRKTLKDAWNSLETVVFVKNSKLETKFEEIKAKFKQEGKVDAYGNVSELLLFHGTSNESINKIVENNFCLDQKPDGPRNKVTLFGHGIYFSELPGVSLMYGTGLLLCKVILGKSQRYYPNGSPPPEIPDEFDSRVVIKDGIEVVTVVKNPAQILPYCILNIKQDRIENAGVRSIQQQQPNNQVKILAPG